MDNADQKDERSDTLLKGDELELFVSLASACFGASEWITRGGGYQTYYFNWDKFYPNVSPEAMQKFHDIFADQLKEVAKLVGIGPEPAPVLAYVTPSGGPLGVVQSRAALAERLNWPSVVVQADQRLLRSRLNLSMAESAAFPRAASWIVGREALLVSDAVTTGASLAHAKGTLLAFGCETRAAVALFNRDEGGSESLKTVGIRLWSLLAAGDAENGWDHLLKNREVRSKIKRGTVKIQDLSLELVQGG